jgi:hypothetical protein
MPDTRKTDPAALFQAALTACSSSSSRSTADTINGNHGDHMVEIFQAAVEAARQTGKGLAEAMQNASLALRELTGNGSACLYAQAWSSLPASSASTASASTTCRVTARTCCGRERARTGSPRLCSIWYGAQSAGGRLIRLSQRKRAPEYNFSAWAHYSSSGWLTCRPE